MNIITNQNTTLNAIMQSDFTMDFLNRCTIQSVCRLARTCTFFMRTIYETKAYEIISRKIETPQIPLNIKFLNTYLKICYRIEKIGCAYNTSLDRLINTLRNQAFIKSIGTLLGEGCRSGVIYCSILDVDVIPISLFGLIILQASLAFLQSHNVFSFRDIARKEKTFGVLMQYEGSFKKTQKTLKHLKLHIKNQKFDRQTFSSIETCLKSSKTKIDNKMSMPLPFKVILKFIMLGFAAAIYIANIYFFVYTLYLLYSGQVNFSERFMNGRY